MKIRHIVAVISFFGAPSLAAADCVLYNFEPHTGSGFAGFGQFENRCPYQVLIRFRYSNGDTGLAGPLNSGENERGYHGEAREIEYSWCDFSASACTPSTIRDASLQSVAPEQRTRAIIEAEIRENDAKMDALQIRLENVCDEYRKGARPISDCEAVGREILDLTLEYSDLTLELVGIMGDSSPEPSDGIFRATGTDGIANTESTGRVPQDCFVPNSEFPSMGDFINACDQRVYCQLSDRQLVNPGAVVWSSRHTSGANQYGFFNNYRLETCTFEERR